MSPEEISSAFAGNPKLASGFIWIDPPASKTDPKQKAKDLETLREAAKANGNFGASEANLSLVRDALGAGFTEYQINQAIRSNAVRLAPPSEEERQQWAAEAQEQEQQRLRNLNTRELKTEVSAGFEQRRAQAAQAEADRVLKAKEEADQLAGGYPELPEFFKGHRVDRAFFVKKCSREELKFLVQKFGAANVEKRIRGIR